MSDSSRRLRIAVVGSGISGLAAAWLLATRHEVTLLERDHRIGGHSNTAIVDDGTREVAVDTGFIVYNEPAYPNLTALLAHLEVPTTTTNMSFSVSLDGGRLEYAGGTWAGLVAQPANLLKPSYLAMLRDIVRFYREGPGMVAAGAEGLTLGDLIDKGGFCRAFRDDHILPMAGAIWSAPAKAMLDYPAAAFVRFFENHGLLRLSGRPLWRTVVGGSRSYVARLMADFPGTVRIGAPVRAISRLPDGVGLSLEGSEPMRFDHVVLATHADDALALIADADRSERSILGAFRYSQNRTVLHSDPALMPRRRLAWASWNYIASGDRRGDDGRLSATYWMNSLQRLDTDLPLFVSLNPAREPRADLVHREEIYTHPLLDLAASRAQKALWSLQGRRNTWFCGAHFGAGFHEDGLQAGLAVAEALGGVRRPWRVADPSGRIHVGPPPAAVVPALSEHAA
ncbi:MAG: FAD-dependent oxidoreductase [Hyphomicrobiaceae bacterium]